MAVGFDVDDHPTPKLALSKPPYCKPIGRPPHARTPPPRSPASIPFRWEEAPGKPRAAAGKVANQRGLDLPPRLKPLRDEDGDFAVMPSPTTVLDGPYVGRSLSLACTFSFRRGPAAVRGDGARRGGVKGRSRRWGSFRDERRVERGNLDFSCSLGDLFRNEKKKRNWLFSYSWGDMYASLKQAVPATWRTRADGKSEC